MFHALHYLLTGFMALCILAVPLLVGPSAMVYAVPPPANDPGSQVIQGACGAAGQEECADGTDRINSVIEAAIRILQVIAGIITVVYLTIAGIKYTTSGGDSTKISSAKNAIIYALIGIAVVALAEIMVQFVLNRVNQAGTPNPPTTYIMKSV